MTHCENLDPQLRKSSGYALYNTSRFDFDRLLFNQYFYKHAPPRPLEAIEEDIRKIGKKIMTMLAEVTRGS